MFVSAPGVDLEAMAARAKTEGVVVHGHANEAGEWMLQVNTSLLRKPVDEVARVLLGAAGG